MKERWEPPPPREAVDVAREAPADPPQVFLRQATDEEQRAAVERALDERGPDGITERWKLEFIPPSVRALCDSVLAARWPKLDPVFEPVVDAVQSDLELSSLVFTKKNGRPQLQLTFRLGALAALLVLEPSDMAEVDPAWPDKLAVTLRRLRGKRSSMLVEPKSDEQLAFEARQRTREGQQ